ncbi:hypothetical protein [Halorarius litoreus]|uniref:hypothetical protein n=1 Tax=Halorarius litoreus TaxID=2962676 RepID=UPI0020CE984B|nr:hypothetical protein [Halorarius litoreus]
MGRFEHSGSPRYRYSALLAAAVNLVLAVPMAAAWHYTGPTTDWTAAAPIPRLVGPVLAAAGALSVPGSLSAYYVYGRPFVLVYALLLVGVVGFHRTYARGGSRVVTGSFGVTVLGLLVALCGDVAAYWGGRGTGFTPVQSGGFAVELVGLLGVVLATSLYGVALARMGLVARRVAWLLGLSAPLAVAGTLAFGYVPHGTVLPLAVVWAVLALVDRRRVRPPGSGVSESL